ncbi:MAG TPA: hypothetical protein ENN60_01980 [archaeon]|nr:hypothetical protein [archaeon]
MTDNSTERLHLTYEEVDGFSRELARRLKPLLAGRVHKLVAVSRGGLVPARIMADELGIWEIHCIGAHSYQGMRSGELSIYQDMGAPSERGELVVLVDEVVDWGRTLADLKKHLEASGYEVMTAVIMVKPHRTFEPDLWMDETDRWIVFPWESRESADL